MPPTQQPEVVRRDVGSVSDMAIDVDVRDGAFELAISGWHRAICLSRGVTLRTDEVVSADVRSWADLKGSIGWRVGGGYFPGKLATGWFTRPGRKGERQLLAVFAQHRESLLVVETTRRKPSRVVVATPQAAEFAARLRR
jgi:hypothetical protein